MVGVGAILVLFDMKFVMTEVSTLAIKVLLSLMYTGPLNKCECSVCQAYFEGANGK